MSVQAVTTTLLPTAPRAGSAARSGDDRAFSGLLASALATAAEARSGPADAPDTADEAGSPETAEASPGGELTAGTPPSADGDGAASDPDPASTPGSTTTPAPATGPPAWLSGTVAGAGTVPGAGADAGTVPGAGAVAGTPLTTVGSTEAAAITVSTESSNAPGVADSARPGGVFTSAPIHGLPEDRAAAPGTRAPAEAVATTGSSVSENTTDTPRATANQATAASDVRSAAGGAIASAERPAAAPVQQAAGSPPAVIGVEGRATPDGIAVTTSGTQANAPGPASTPTPPSAAALPSTAAQVIDRVAHLVQHDGTHRITVKLQPESLGEVRVVLSVRHGDVHVRIAAGDIAAQILSGDAGELRRVLEQAGVTEARVQVRDSSGSIVTHPGGGGSQDTGAQPGHDQPEARMPGTHLATDGDHRSGESAPDPVPVSRARAAGLDLTI